MSSTYLSEEERMKHETREGLRGIKQAGEHLGSDIEGAASRMAERASQARDEVRHSVGEVGQNFREAVERSVERQPITTLLLAVATGVVIGGLMRR